MAELGTTNDPKALVPGDAGTLDGTVQMLTSYGDMLAESGTGLQRIDTSDGWSGTAADGFHKAFQGQPGKWIEAGGAFHSAAQAVGDYINTLTWAQGQAASAIREYDAGQAATQQAQADHARAVQQAQAQAASSGTTAPNIPFTDPGEAQRQAAQQTLDRARKQLTDAGNTAADTVDKAKDKAPPKPSFWSQLGSDIQNVAGSALHGLENAGKDVVNGVASFGNAAIHHPGELAATVGGIGLTVLSAAGEGGGLVLDATGVGAIAGVPLNAVSAAGMATGVGITGASIAAMASHAAGDDHVEPLKTDSSGSGTSGGEEPPFEAPKEIAGRTEHGEQQIQTRDGHGVNDEAVNDAVANPTQPPRYIPDKYGGTYRYTGKNAYVNLNKDGQVVTAWARNSSGWRTP
jgi:type VII secretion system ESX-1 substrate